MQTVFAHRTRPWLWTGASVAVVGGLYLAYGIAYRSFLGERDALGLLASFTLMAVLLFNGVKTFWTLILDTRDALDIFKETAIAHDAQIHHIRRDVALETESILESGYEMTFVHDGTPIHIALAHLGKKIPGQKNLSEEHDLLTFRVDAKHDLRMAIVNPRYEVRETLDVEYFAPSILHSKKYTYYEHGIVFSDFDSEDLDRLFDDSFIQIQLMALFGNYQFKFVVFGESDIRAVKSVTSTSISYDMESYPALIHLRNVLGEQLKKMHSLSIKGDR